MKRNEHVDFEIPLILLDFLKEKTGLPVFPVGMGETPKDSSFIEVSLLSLSYSHQITRTADFLLWVYTPVSEGLEQSFIEGDEARKVLNSSIWGVRTLQALQIENGNVLTDSPYPSFYAQEISFWGTYVHKPLPPFAEVEGYTSNSESTTTDEGSTTTDDWTTSNDESTSSDDWTTSNDESTSSDEGSTPKDGSTTTEGSTTTNGGYTPSGESTSNDGYTLKDGSTPTNGGSTPSGESTLNDGSTPKDGSTTSGGSTPTNEEVGEYNP